MIMQGKDFKHELKGGFQEVQDQTYDYGLGLDKRFSENREKREHQAERYKVSVEQEKANFRVFYECLSSDHDVHKEIQAMIDEIGKAADIDMSDFSLVVFDSVLPDAHITPLGKEIRISSGLIKAFNNDSELVEAVVAHEIGHYFFSNIENEDPLETYAGQKFDPIRTIISRYEEEYQSDRFSIFMLNRLGKDTGALRRSLNTLEKNSRTLFDEYDLGDISHPEFWIKRTHPHHIRRSLAARKIERMFPGGEKSTKKLGQLEFNYENSIISQIGMYEIGDYVDYTSVMKKGKEDLQWYHVNLVNIDCFWNEINDVIADSAADLIQEEASAGALDYLPDEVMKFTDSDKEKIQQWWKQAMELSHVDIGVEDLEMDIEEYDIKAIKTLLGNLEIHKFWRKDKIFTVLQHEDSSKSPKDEVYKSDERTDSLLGNNDYAYVPAEMRYVSSLLVRQWSKQYPESQSFEWVKDAITFFQEFRRKTGFFFPYDMGRIMRTLHDVFENADHQGKREIAKFVKENDMDLKRGFTGAVDLISHYTEPMRKYSKSELMADRAETHPVGAFETIDELESQIQSFYEQLVSKSPSECRDFLSRVAAGGVISYENYTELVAKYAHTALQDYGKMRSGAQTLHSADFERMREADPMVAVRLLSTEEFEDAFFGEGRSQYIKANYTMMESRIALYRQLSEIWKQAQYEDEVSVLEDELDKADMILETFPAVCGQRDLYLIEAVGWGKVEYVDDLKAVAEKISTVEDIKLLFLFSKHVSNSYIKLLCSQQLWSLYRADKSSFFKEVAKEDMEGMSAMISDLPENFRSHSDLQAILLCFQHPSYIRDELLKIFIDKAPSEEITLQLASFLLEPPAGVVKKREHKSVMTSESLIDGMEYMSAIDKQEVLLYLLGQREFYSGIDALFPGTSSGDEDYLRKEMLILGRENFELKHEEDMRFMYIVEEPDSVVILSKYTGTSIDLLLEQQSKLTTRREELDMMTFMLLGEEGILRDSDKDKFLDRVASVLTDRGTFLRNTDPSQKKAITELLGFSLKSCPEEKIPDLFLNLWYLSREKEVVSIPELTAQLFREYGPVFVKAGQYLATQSTSLPPEWTAAFRGLSDKNIVSEKTILYEIEHQAYKGNPPFDSVGEKLGEGSMAAVYRGKLKGGEDIAAKVLHPFIENELDGDIEFLDGVVEYINRNSASYGGVKLPGNLSEITLQHMREEIDLKNEVRNNEKLKKVLALQYDQVSFSLPKVYKKESNKNFLVMEYKSGVPVDSDEKLEKMGLDIQQVRSATALEILRQIVKEGVYHADANPGNFSVEKSQFGNPIVNFLDTGHLGKLNKSDRGRLKDFLLSYGGGALDSEAAVSFFSSITQVGANTSKKEIQQKLKNWFSSKEAQGVGGMANVQEYFTSLLGFYDKEKLLLKDQWVLLLRTFGLMRPLLAEVKQEQFVQFMLENVQE